MSDDILHAIDRVVDDAREQHCACGCGAELSAGGPSRNRNTGGRAPRTLDARRTR